MLKNYIKEDQKLPLFGVGPHIVVAMAAVTIIGIVLFGYVFKIGILNTPWTWIFRTAGAILIIAGIVIWLISAFCSGMDESIAENKLKTDGIYALTRNPMYNGWWLMISGITLMWGNAFMLILPFVNRLIMTVILINTEEKWLSDLYGDEYNEYKRKVKRFIP